MFQLTGNNSLFFELFRYKVLRYQGDSCGYTIQGPESALLDNSDYRWENDSYIISIALEWHEAIKKRREQAFRIRELELRVREQENKPGTGELIITCDV